jgi:hypothetical protein
LMESVEALNKNEILSYARARAIYAHMVVQIVTHKDNVFGLALLDKSVEISFAKELLYFPATQIPNLIHQMSVALSEHMLLISLFRAVVFTENEMLKISCDYFNHPFQKPDLIVSFSKPSTKEIQIEYGKDEDKQTFTFPVSKSHVLARQLMMFYRENNFCAKCLYDSCEKVLGGGYPQILHG